MISSSWADVFVPILLILTSVVLSPIPIRLVPLFSKNARKQSTSSSTIESKEVAEHGRIEEQYGGYILPVQIHHARILPKESQHQFRYPSIFLAMDLEEMEKGKMELNRVFSWSPLSKKDNGKNRWSCTRLDPEGFGRRSFFGLSENVQSKLSNSMLLKLLYELRLRGYTSVGPQDKYKDRLPLSSMEEPDHSSDSNATYSSAPWSKEVGKVWAVAMPSLLGMGGFNPLTIYFVYRPTTPEEGDGLLWLVVLEVHNTFNERHVYICQVGVKEDADKSVTQRRRYQHSWTFPRAFHVSPFNDRSGYYQLLISDLWSNKEERGVPTLDVRLLLLVEEGDDEDDGTEDEDYYKQQDPPKLLKKLLATLTSSQAKSSSIRPYRLAQPLTSSNMLKALLSQPLDLILPVSRIMWQAAKLHWKRRLPVFIRPEQRGQGLAGEDDRKGPKGEPFDGLGWPIDLNPTQPKKAASSFSGAIYWNQDGFIEQACQAQFDTFLCRQTANCKDLVVSIISRNTEVRSTYYLNGEKYQQEPVYNSDKVHTFTFYTLSSSLYLDFAMYTPTQARLFGSIVDRNWGVSSIQEFHRLFDLNSTTNAGNTSQSRKTKVAAWARQSHLKWAIKTTVLAQDEPHQKVARKLLDEIKEHPYNSMDTSLSYLIALLLHLLIIRLTAAISGLLHIRYVRQPWSQVVEGFQVLCAESQ